ncbi:Hypothetical predicted protein [Mytilus galloprovincialis]|uniref:Uncharacterized protein n=1 Tax=Mytilus galloprovincialis TaxID=29158 RepID=A0A8B6FQP3_MYTGA|nr:Hypothetical predicted protein [Mytilus galloprovincialis]
MLSFFSEWHESRSDSTNIDVVIDEFGLDDKGATPGALGPAKGYSQMPTANSAKKSSSELNNSTPSSAAALYSYSIVYIKKRKSQLTYIVHKDGKSQKVTKLFKRESPGISTDTDKRGETTANNDLIIDGVQLQVQEDNARSWSAN